MAIKGIVVDVDDTLYLEREYVRSGFRHIEEWLTAEHGISGVGPAAWRLFERGVRNSTIGDALQAIAGDTFLLSQCVQRYRDHNPAISLLPDASRFLRGIDADAHLAVVTDGPASSQKAKCIALGLFEIAERVVITQEMGTSKPDPAVFEAAVEGWGLSPKHLVYIADNPMKDFEAPRALGWRSIRVRRNGSLHQTIATPDGVVEVEDMTPLTQER